ncbi:hypothetical protein R69927_01616 [Paraburkholderia domus]|uniref:Uncharacterized protein n=1 Tax=Paraburkholderia domus TaxID=2793075 RepID=A0A9N8MTS4_9BURK|nr:hypothetical protein R75483_00144 [Paraburkholderia domus]CAE6700654.1 hypothetical protein R70006_00712 [Paraburkholderia domus]CAE6797171.1 hypothetical protein R69749_02431 [Paraburkholderia domus]CAE6841692.1 hypothetical protein R69927_01616 [Paraburkholderia domus]CAE6876002.1 hypothetical protein R70199_02122 [Paraburkholderia domus]
MSAASNCIAVHKLWPAARIPNEPNEIAGDRLTRPA